MCPTGLKVQQIIAPAQGTASGSNTMFVTATSRETGIRWRSPLITAKLPKYRCLKNSGQPALNSKVQQSGDGCWIEESSPGRKAGRRSLTWNPSETGGSGWPRNDLYHAFNAHHHTSSLPLSLTRSENIVGIAPRSVSPFNNSWGIRLSIHIYWINRIQHVLTVQNSDKLRIQGGK